jgi:hypothetical protein
MAKGKHGNLNSNDSLHHLYCIEENLTEEFIKYGLDPKGIQPDIFKYGISQDEVRNGTSDRLQMQVEEDNNIVGAKRFSGKILIEGIFGRRKAKEIEDEHIEGYYQEYGRFPRGNKVKNKK